MKTNKEMNEETLNQVIEYVYKNYKYLKNKTLIVKEFDNHFQINDNEDSSPLILGKKILI
jgi:hypothetical protein|tara:strand:- start:108 stop:287 length:180 start_codon:yes stop_codon:yes gene_type:complete